MSSLRVDSSALPRSNARIDENTLGVYGKSLGRPNFCRVSIDSKGVRAQKKAAVAAPFKTLVGYIGGSMCPHITGSVLVCDKPFIAI